MSSFNTISRNRLQTSTMLTSVIAVMALSQPAHALPAGGNVVAGQATIATAGTNTDITQSSNRALIEWGNFDIGSNESVNFFQPSSSAIALNRVTGGLGASQINGMLNANGNVIIVNSQGVMFGAGAQVNVGGLVATTADTDNSRFMNGELTFDRAGSANAKIQNDGTIKIADGGLSLFVGPNVSNNGLIQANLGKVQLASGETFAVDMYGDGLLSVQASDTLSKQLVQNSGKIDANGGQVLLTAAAAQNAIESVINMDGIIEANTIAEKGGKVILSGANSTTLVSGKINAKGATGQKGGNVDVLGKNVGILTSAAIDASGDIGGGVIRVGGDYQGSGNTPTAQNTIIQSGAGLLANAVTNGDGGKVIVWSDNSTLFAGSIEAKGGALGGNGGFVETSGKENLDAFGSVNASAIAGNAGTWLLDPNNIRINNSADSNVTGNPNFTTTADGGRVSVASIQTNLNNGTNVTITTGTAGLNNQNGNITVESNISKTSGNNARLTLNAHNNITVDPGVSISSSDRKLHLNFNANGGRINLDSGSSINTNGGDVSFVANGNVVLDGAVNTGTGTFLATSATGNINILSGGTVASAATGDAIILVANSGNFTNNRGVDALTASAGRWLVYSTNPSNDTIGGLVSGFKRYSCSYGGSCPTLGSGNGLLYSFTPTLTITADAASTTYGQVAPAFTYSLSGYLGSDGASDNVTGAASMTTPYVQGNNAGSYNITAAQGTLASEMGYGFTGSTLTNGLTVDKAALAITATSKTQTYGDGNSFNGFSSTGLYGADTVGSVTFGTNATNSTSGNWIAGTWNITASGATGGTFNPNNYTITYNNGVLTVNQKALTVTASANDKVYDASTTATVTLSDDRVLNDVLTASNTSADFDTKDVNTNKTVTVNGISISGTDSANYTVNASTTDLADITARGLTVTANNQSQTYGDGNNLTSGISTSGLQGSDAIDSTTLTTNAIDSSSSNWNAGSWSITASNATGINFDPNNYTITYVDGSLSIAQKSLSITLTTATDKVYDGTNAATAVLQTDNRVSGDALSYGFTDATFSDKNVGNDKTVTVNGLFVTGADAGNYNLNTSASALADITPANLTVTANNQSQTYGDGNNLTSGISTSGLQGTDAIDSTTLTTNAVDSTSGNWNAGTWTITASNATGVNFDPNNYTITYNNGTLTIAQKSLVVSAVANNKVYDGNRNATVTLSNDALAGDVVNNGFTTARFGNKNAANNKTVTVNGITISGGADAGNYSLSNTTATDQANITKAALSVTANNQSQVYGDGNVLGNGYQVTGLVAGETVGSVSLGTNAGTSGSGNWNAGTWNIIASGATGGTFDSGNYSITYNNGTLSILQKSLTASVNASDKIYDGNRTAAVTFSDNRISGDVFSETYTQARFNNRNVGNNKTVTVDGVALSGADAGNYALSTTTLTDTAKITPASLTITANDQTQTYGDGNVLTAGVTATGLVAGETLGSVDLGTTATNSSSGNWNAGAWDINASNAADNGNFRATNYNITYTDGTLTVTPKALTITANSQSQTYGDGNNLTAGFASAGLVGAESIGSVTLATNAVDSTSGNWNAGSWTITASNATGGTFDANNYAISYANGSLSIAQKALIVSATAQDKVYNGNTTATVTLSDDRIGGDVLTASNTSADFDTKDVGTNKTVTVNGISISGTDSANYTANTTTTDLADITPASLTVTANDKSMTYGDGNTLSGFSSSGLQGTDVIDTVDLVAGASSSTSGNWNAGTWSITASNAAGVTFDPNNYTITYNNGTLTIAQKSLVVTAVAQDKTYDGNRTATVTLSNDAISGDVVDNNYTTARFGNKNANTNKTVTVNGISISGTDSGNYSLSNTTATDTADIFKRALTITAVADDKVYDGDRIATVTLSDDRVAGDTFNSETYNNARFDTRHVGNDKTVTVNGLNISGGDAQNYTFNTTTTALADITPASLTITANGQTQVYGDGNNLTAGVSSSGLVVGETLGSVDLATTATDSTSGNWNAGTWDITASNAADNGRFRATNYTITYVDGSLVITPKALTVTASVDDKVYDGTTTATVNLLSDNRISGDLLTASNTSADFDTKNVGTDKTVTVDGISITGTDSANYTVNTTTTDLADITPATLFVDADDQTKVYGSADPTLTFAYSGFVAGEDSSLFTGGLDRDAGENVVGSPYNINLGSLSAGGNYTIDYTGGVLTITPYSLTVIADDQTKVYGDVDPTLTYSFGTLQNGDDASVFTGGLIRDPGENVAGGPYVINQGSLDAGSNYTISYIDALFRITPASLNVTADSHFITMGDNIPPLTYVATGFKFADDYSIFTGGLSTVPKQSLPGVYGINRGTLEANANYTINYTRGFISIASPFSVNNTSEQTSDFKTFNGPKGATTLLSVSNGGGGTGGGGLGNLAPAAGGENLGDLNPAAGGNAFALLECDEAHPCETLQ